MSETLEREIAALPKMNIHELRATWRSQLKQPPPHIRKQLMVPLLAYKLQEQAYGGLKPEIRRQIEKLGAAYQRDPKAKASPAAVGRQRIKPGTSLLRQWNGETHQVMVVEGGFEYEGERYKSLSVIARLITGTRWSGPAFFGLKGRRP